MGLCFPSKIKQKNTYYDIKNKKEEEKTKIEKTYFNHIKKMKQSVIIKNQKSKFLKKKRTRKIIDFTNTYITELNYSAKRITKYFKDQTPYYRDELFEDDVFPANRNSILGLDAYGISIDPNVERRKEAELEFNINDQGVIWLRPDDIFGVNNYALFEGNIEFDDVRQGSIGNCYLMASLSALTEVPQIIAELFRQHEVQKNGYYEVCLKLDGEWQVIILDDYFPCSKKTLKPIFANAKNNELWALLLEKAWAKANGGYIFTVAGVASEVIECLTNFPYECQNILNSDKEVIWNKILEASGNDYVMTTSLPQIEKNLASELGLIDGHMYTLEEGKEIRYKGKNIRLLKIRNPWGDGESSYKGDWSQYSSLWNDELKEKFNYKDTYDNEGEFFISFDDFLKLFVDLDFCLIKDRICLKQSVIPYTFDIKPFIYEIVLPEDSIFDIVIFKPYWRFIKDLPTDWNVTQQLFLGKYEENEEINTQMKFFSTGNCFDLNCGRFTEFYGAREGQSDCALNLKLKKGRYFLVALVNYNFSINDETQELLDISLIQTLSSVISFYSTEFFEFRLIDESIITNNVSSLSILQKMCYDYANKHTDKFENKKPLLIYSKTNVVNSDYNFIYFKNISSKTLDFEFKYKDDNIFDVFYKENNDQILIDHIHSKFNSIESKLKMQKIVSTISSVNDDAYNMSIRLDMEPDRELILVFSSFDMYNNTKFDYLYSFKKKETKNMIKILDLDKATLDNKDNNLYQDNISNNHLNDNNIKNKDFESNNIITNEETSNIRNNENIEKASLCNANILNKFPKYNTQTHSIKNNNEIGDMDNSNDNNRNINIFSGKTTISDTIKLNKYQRDINDSKKSNFYYVTNLQPKLKIFDTSNISDLNNYKWIYKKGDVDYTNILKKIDTTEAAFNYFKNKYPKEVKLIEKIPKIALEDYEITEVQDKVEFSATEWYFGEWKQTNNENILVMHGRGVFFIDNIYYAGQFINGDMNGFGIMIQTDKSLIEGNFVNFNPVGICTITYSDGKVSTLEYEIPTTNAENKDNHNNDSKIDIENENNNINEDIHGINNYQNKITEIPLNREFTDININRDINSKNEIKTKGIIKYIDKAGKSYNSNNIDNIRKNSILNNTSNLKKEPENDAFNGRKLTKDTTKKVIGNTLKQYANPRISNLSPRQREAQYSKNNTNNANNTLNVSNN